MKHCVCCVRRQWNLANNCFLTALWQGQYGLDVGGIYVDKLNVSSNLDIVKVILDPPIQPMPSSHQSKEVAELCALQMAITAEFIWILRNKVMQDGGQVNITTHIRNLKNKEFVLALEQSKDLQDCKVISRKPPSAGVIKLNVDAAIQKDFTSLAVIA